MMFLKIFNFFSFKIISTTLTHKQPLDESKMEEEIWNFWERQMLNHQEKNKKSNEQAGIFLRL